MKIKPVCKNCKYCKITVNKKIIPLKWFKNKEDYNHLIKGKENNVYCKFLEVYLLKGKIKTGSFDALLAGNTLPMKCFKKRGKK